MAQPGSLRPFPHRALEDRLRKPEADMPVVTFNVTPAHLAPLPGHPLIFLYADRTGMPLCARFVSLDESFRRRAGRGS